MAQRSPRAIPGRPAAKPIDLKALQPSFTNKFGDFWFHYIEMPIQQLGLGSPSIRFTVFSLGSAVALFLLKPPGLFDQKTGKPLPWIVIDDKSPNAVLFDWVLLSLLIGSMSVLFI